MQKVRDLEIKKMPVEEKYDRLLDDCFLGVAANYVFHKELGTMDKWMDHIVKVDKKMLPSYLGPVFKLLKILAPGRTFKQVMNQYIYTIQRFQPLSNMELTWVSDREAFIRIKNC